MIVDLEGFTPSPRYAPITTPWTSARIEKAPADTGPWTTVIGPFALDPVPALLTPSPYDFSVFQEDETPTWYRVVWLDAEGESDASAPVRRDLDAGSLRPTVAVMGALMRARTKVRGGAELGTFRDGSSEGPETRPTATQVDEVIDRVLPTVELALGRVREEHLSSARTAVAYRVAQVLELEFWPEQNDTDESPAAKWGDLYADTVRVVTSAVTNDDAGSTVPRFGSLRVLGIDGV